MKTLLSVLTLAALGGCAVVPAPTYVSAPVDPYQWHQVPSGPTYSDSRVEYSSEPTYATQSVYVQQPVYVAQPLYAPAPYYYYPPVTFGLGFMFGNGWYGGGRGYYGGGRGGYGRGGFHGR